MKTQHHEIILVVVVEKALLKIFVLIVHALLAKNFHGLFVEAGMTRFFTIAFLAVKRQYFTSDCVL